MENDTLKRISKILTGDKEYVDKCHVVSAYEKDRSFFECSEELVKLYLNIWEKKTSKLKKILGDFERER